MLGLEEFVTYFVVGTFVLYTIVCALKKLGAIKQAAVFAVCFVLLATCALATGHAEGVSATIAGVDFRNGEVYAVTRSGDIYSWYETDVDKDDILGRNKAVFDEDGEHIRLGCKIILDIVDGRVEDRILTGFVKDTQMLLLSFDGKNVFGCVTNPVVAGYMMTKFRCGVMSTAARKEAKK